MKTRIFSYKGNLGATTDIENGVFINDVMGEGQLGCVVSTDQIEITEGAKEMIRNAKREGGSFATIMLTDHNDGGSSIGLMGFNKHHFGTSIEIGRDCELSVLDKCEVVGDEIIPDDYKEFIDRKV